MTITDLLPPGVTPEDTITAMAGLSAFLSVVAVWQGLVRRENSGRRLRELSQRRQTLREDYLLSRKKRGALLATGFMRRIVDRLQLLRSSKGEAIQRRLAQAGWRSTDALVRYLFAKFALPFVFGGLAVILFEVRGLYDLPGIANLGITIACVLVGSFLPDIFLKNGIIKRATKIRRGLPDALDLMVICAEAGLSLDALLKRVSEEFGRSCPELADELAITSLELGFLPDRRQALVNLMQRTDSRGIRGLVNSLLQSDKYGTPLAQSLRVLAAEFREERMLKAEEKAARLPALLTVPMIVFILPPLFIVLVGPAALKTIDALSGM
ncbi:MAG: type II secretion system F family protein [Pseudomonadota bacterium]